MKYYLRKTVITLIALYSAYALIPSAKFGPDYKNFVIAIASLLLVSLFIKPLFSLILIPINFFTHAVASLLLNLIVVYALLFFLPGFTVSAFDFQGANFEGFVIPSYSFSQMYAVILFAFIVTVVQKTLHAIFE